jgi:maltooligosyltrehalose trehalohydrolase
MLFHGEEWGASAPFLYFTDHSEPELGRAVTEGRKREFAAFGWDPTAIPDPQSRETFERSKLDWNEISREPHRGLFDWHRRLVRLRLEVPALADGRLDRVRVRFDEEKRWLVVHRSEVAVCVNLAGEPRRLPLDDSAGRPVRLASREDVRVADGHAELPPESVAIVG